MPVKKIIQFGYRVKVPDEVRNGSIPVVDCRVIPNPYPKFAHDRVAARHAVHSSPEFALLVSKALRLLHDHDVIAVGCGYGVHRSGGVVEEVVGESPFEIEVEKRGE